MEITKEFLEERLEQLKETENREQINKLDNERKRHPAFKQLRGRILEIEYLIALKNNQSNTSVKKNER